MSTSSLLAISGSLRAGSLNTEVLRAAGLVAPPSAQITLFGGLAELPHFNPDLDAEGAALPVTVRAFRARVAAADGLLICSPEYAHGVPGALKNALDWLVSGPEIVYKPIGLLNASPRSTHAQASLAETLRTMSAVLVPDASIDVPLPGRGLDAAGIAADGALAQLLRAAVEALVSAVPHYRQVRESLGLAPATGAADPAPDSDLASTMLTLVVTLTVRRTALADFRAFEHRAASIMQTHGGMIERALVLDPDSHSDTIRELHIVRFPSAASFAAYRADSRLSELAELRARSLLATEIAVAVDGPAYSGFPSPDSGGGPGVP